MLPWPRTSATALTSRRPRRLRRTPGPWPAWWPGNPASWPAFPVARAVLDAAGIPPGSAEPLRADGDRVDAGTEVLRVNAPLRELLGAERTLLNFLTHLSGVATATRAWVDALSGTGCVVRDTRKTTPGLRQLEKYAVRCGGGQNHRMGLGDAALIKDNHVIAAGGIPAAIAAVRSAAPSLPLEVECDTLAQVREALEAGVDLILLDNMDLGGLREAVALAARYPSARLEASGGLRLRHGPGRRADWRGLRRRRRPHPLKPRARPEPGRNGAVTGTGLNRGTC